jgi:hypothetical protein
MTDNNVIPLATPLYDRMCLAIAECARVDEAKDIRDKTAALEVYYRQAHNSDAEREACNIRLRAERRVGELLKELARVEPQERAQRANIAQGRLPRDGANDSPSPYGQALIDNGISRQDASRMQRLADVPADVFEAALAQPGKPTLSALIDEPRGEFQVTDQSLIVWGHLRDLNQLLADPEAAEPLHRMTNEMREDVVRIIPILVGQLQAFTEAIHERA